jgi:hypothetical protein
MAGTEEEGKGKGKGEGQGEVKIRGGGTDPLKFRHLARHIYYTQPMEAGYKHCSVAAENKWSDCIILCFVLYFP